MKKKIRFKLDFKISKLDLRFQMNFNGFTRHRSFVAIDLTLGLTMSNHISNEARVSLGNRYHMTTFS